MLLINGLTSRSFSDFDNMFKALDLQYPLYNRTYIAILVCDKVALERDQARRHEVNGWFKGEWYPIRYKDQFENRDVVYDSDNVGDIED